MHIFALFSHEVYILAMVVRMRHTKSHTANRRSHHALSDVRMSLCKDCGSAHRRHHVCGTCGKYRGKTVIDMVSVIEKNKKRAEAKAKQLGIEEKKEATPK